MVLGALQTSLSSKLNVNACFGCVNDRSFEFILCFLSAQTSRTIVVSTDMQIFIDVVKQSEVVTCDRMQIRFILKTQLGHLTPVGSVEPLNLY